MDVASTMWFDQSPAWTRRVHVVDARGEKYWRHQRAVRRVAAEADHLVLLGSHGFAARYRDVVSALLLKTLPRRRRPVTLLVDATWEIGSRSLRRYLGARGVGLLARAVVRLVDGPHMRYGVLSTAEVPRFADAWSVEASRVFFLPFVSTLTDADRHAATRPVTDPADVFAGGNSLRDYDLLIGALRELDASCRIATSGFVPDDDLGGRLQHGALTHEDFMQQLGAARVVAVPLVFDSVRSAGQQTYLNAVALGKPVVVNDAAGVRDYLVDGEHARIVPNADPHAFADAISWCLDNPEQAAAMAERGRHHVEQNYPYLSYPEHILELVDGG